MTEERRVSTSLVRRLPLRDKPFRLPEPASSCDDAIVIREARMTVLIVFGRSLSRRIRDRVIRRTSYGPRCFEGLRRLIGDRLPGGA